MHTIKIYGIKVYAFHGCLPEEGVIGQEYEVNVNFNLTFEEAAKEDDLSKTVDYVRVYKIVHTEMAIRSKLIESVARRIHNSLKSAYPYAKSEVEVVKFSPPVNGIMQYASVIYTD